MWPTLCLAHNTVEGRALTLRVRKLRSREARVSVKNLLGLQLWVGREATGSEALTRAYLPYMLIPGMAGPRELGGGLMPLP